MLASRAFCRIPKLRCDSLRTPYQTRILLPRRTPINRPYSSTPDGDTTTLRDGDRAQDQATVQDRSVEHEKDGISGCTNESQLEQELQNIQDVAIADLEKRLGKSIWQAIQEDGLVERIKNGDFDIRDNRQLDLSTSEPLNDSVSELRESGAAAEDIAREARNIHGEYLPESVLSQEEIKVYTRLYGEPLPAYSVSESPHLDRQQIDGEELHNNTLLDLDGQNVPYHLENEEDIEKSMIGRSQRLEPDISEKSEDTMSTSFYPVGLEAIAKEVGGSIYNPEEYDELEDEEDSNEADDRMHPLTRIGKFTTHPRTFYLPKETFVQPVQTIMRDYSNKHLKEACEKLFGGPGLPHSPLTPRSAQSLQQLPIPLDAGQHSMGQMEANAFLTTIMPPTYASIQATLVETRKRLGSLWLNRLLARPGGPRVLDAGSGGVGILAWRDITQAHWDQLHTSSKEVPPLPSSKSVVLTGSDALRHRAAAMLENTTFVPRLPDYVHTRDIPTLDDERPAQQRKQFDVIIASHSLFGLKEEWERKQHLQNLWQLLSDKGGVLMLIEKGIPRGFEVVAAAREMLLERCIAVPDGHETHYSHLVDEDAPPKTTGMIVAPCTNHEKCPLYKVGGVSKGRKDICSFQQRYIRPPFLQNILGASDRNHDDVDFSYLVTMKGDDLRRRSFDTLDHVSDPMSAPKITNKSSNSNGQNSIVSRIQAGFEDSDLSPPPTHLLPRILNRPLKRRGHVTIDLCTPTAEIRRWTVPRSFSRQAYRDARKARWGDLWALGAKTSISRNLKVGTPAKDVEGAGGFLKGVSENPRNRKEKLQMQAEKARKAEEAQVDEEEREREELLRLIDEDDLLDDEDDGLIDMDTLLPKKKKQSAKPAVVSDKRVVASRNPASSKSTHLSKNDLDEETKLPTKRGPKSRVRSTDHNILGHDGSGRMGEDDVLSVWSEEFESVMTNDEALRKVAEHGYRATSRNTQRMKRDLRRLKRQNQAS